MLKHRVHLRWARYLSAKTPSEGRERIAKTKGGPKKKFNGTIRQQRFTLGAPKKKG